MPCLNFSFTLDEADVKEYIYIRTYEHPCCQPTLLSRLRRAEAGSTELSEADAFLCWLCHNRRNEFAYVKILLILLNPWPLSGRAVHLFRVEAAGTKIYPSIRPRCHNCDLRWPGANNFIWSRVINTVAKPQNSGFCRTSCRQFPCTYASWQLGEWNLIFRRLCSRIFVPRQWPLRGAGVSWSASGGGLLILVAWPDTELAPLLPRPNLICMFSCHPASGALFLRSPRWLGRNRMACRCWDPFGVDAGAQMTALSSMFDALTHNV